MKDDELLVSVDIEASGPTPAIGSLLSIGACLVEDPSIGIYLELKPIPDLPWSAEAEAVHRLDRAHLERVGLAPADAMGELADWLDRAAAGRRPVFVGFNAPFDWMFVADYLWRFLGRNPFGISALDLKSYYMGREGVELWAETRKANIGERYGLHVEHSHHALHDARDQAHLAKVLMGRRARSLEVEDP